MAQAATDMQGLLSAARLPSMPQILLKLLDLCQSDSAGVTDIAKLVANDAALTARILGVANSAAYQRDGRKAGLVNSLNLLGSEMVKTLLISESVFQTFSGFSNAARLDLGPFWRDALRTAVIARDVAKAMAYPQVEEAYLAGLLHDVGRLALLAAAPAQYEALFLETDEVSLCAAEIRAFGFTHAQAGAWLVERWNLDTFMADSIRYHHEERATVRSAPPMVRIIHTAHALAGLVHETVSDAAALCGVAQADLERICELAQAQVDKSAALLGIVLTDTVRGELSQAVSDMALSSEWTRSLARVTDDAQRLTMIRQSAQVYFDLNDSLVLLQSGNGRELMCVSAARQRQRLLEFAVALAQGGGIAASALHHRMEFVQSGGPQCGLAEDQLLRAMQADALVCLPLIAGTRCLGVVVGAASTAALEALRPRSRFLNLFAAEAAQALNRQALEAAEIDQHIARVRAEFVQRSRGLAHEVNNPLAIIKSYLGVLDEKLGRAEPVTDEITILGEELDRIGNMLGEFAGTQPPRSVSGTDMNRVVQDVVALFQESRYLPPLVQLESRTHAQPCMVEVAPDALRQVLVNLIKNAVEALPTGGNISVTSRAARAEHECSFWALVVSDDGPGVPAAMAEKLFKPMPSTKPGDNRGMGLSIVHGLVQKFGGQIRCSSSAAGTSFEVLVPAQTPQAQKAVQSP